ncbi:MAG: hypothetical protein JWR25_1065, partial [Noviherbaspirillum sp.]|nr:hypothetical protein [Noviherbaspirillum sp.]
MTGTELRTYTKTSLHRIPIDSCASVKLFD